MSAAVDNVQKLHQDLQNELTTANQLLLLISEELKKIKIYTCAGGEFETTIKQNASIIETIANLQKLDIENLLPVAQTQVVFSQQTNQSTMEESQ